MMSELYRLSQMVYLRPQVVALHERRLHRRLRLPLCARLRRRFLRCRRRAVHGYVSHV